MELGLIKGDWKGVKSYKPTSEQYFKALIRVLKRPHLETSKVIFLLVRYLGSINISDLLVPGQTCEATRCLFETTCQMIDWQSPRSFMRIFPVAKEFDGEKYECKDYYSTMREISEIGIDNKIEDSEPFLFEYWNYDIYRFMRNYIKLVDAMHISDGGTSMLLEFFESTGSSLPTYHLNGNLMINNKTGECFVVEPPRKRIPKYLQLVK